MRSRTCCTASARAAAAVSCSSTGEVGTGKTTLCRLLLEQLPENTRVALVLNPKLSPVELVETVCEELKLDIAGRRGSLKALIDTLNAYLLDAYAQGLRVVLIVDEAQNLSIDSLEQVRLLTNLETPTQKLLQIILLGQPELRDVLGRPELRQLAQRITARYHLTPLDARRDRSLRAPSPGGGGRAHSVLAARPACALSALGRHAAPDQHHRRSRPDGRLRARAGFDRRAHRRSRRRRGTARPRALLGAPLRSLGRRGRARARRRRCFLVLARAAQLRTGRRVAAGTGRAPPPADAMLARIGHQLETGSDNELDCVQPAARALAGRFGCRVGARCGRCPGVIVAGIDCLRGPRDTGTTGALRSSVILLLHQDEHQAHALLQGVGRRHVRLDIAGERMNLRALRCQSSGMANSSPSGVCRPTCRPTLRRGDAGAGVAWVKGRLAALDGGAAEPGPAFFDTELEERVRKLQVAYGIKADGIVGPETLFALSALDDSGPRLARTVQ